MTVASEEVLLAVAAVIVQECGSVEESEHWKVVCNSTVLLWNMNAVGN